jgi:hypothetical protein
MAHQAGGRWTTIKVASAASTDYDIGDILYDDGTNPVLGTTTSGNVMGICITDKPSTDATTGDIYIKVPKDRSATFYAAVTGTFTKACEGRFYDLSDELTVNTAATTYKVVRCVKYLSSTSGLFSINDPIS